MNFFDRLKAYFVFFLIVLNTLFFGSVFYILLPLKFFSWGRLEIILSKFFDIVAFRWIAVNNIFFKYISGAKVDINLPDDLDEKGWYLVISNHQTWSDIFLLQWVLFKKVPFLKFFIKKELIYVPVIGLIWWALDFPFMQRFSKKFLKKNPHLKGKDMETTKKSCEKFKFKPVAVMNFTEGTRNRNGKARLFNSPFKNLLRPKAGGAAFVLEAMGDKIKTILDVTIVYPEKSPSLMSFLSGKAGDIVVEGRIMDVEDWMIGDYENSLEFRAKFQDFLNDMWKEKDQKISFIKDGLKEDGAEDASGLPEFENNL